MSWSRPAISGTPPTSRWGHTATLVNHSQICIFGGHDNRTMLNDVHLLDLETLTWIPVPGMTVGATLTEKGDLPPPRAGHSATLIDGRIVIFGGGDGLKIMNDIYILNLNRRTWTQAPLEKNAPTGRCAHAALAVDRRLFIHGGGDGSRRFKDLYIFHAEKLLKMEEVASGKPRAPPMPALPKPQAAAKSNPPPQKRSDKPPGPTELNPEVRFWLQNNGFSCYLGNFLGEELDMETLPLLTEAHLEKMGIATMGGRLRVLAKLRALQAPSRPPSQQDLNSSVAELLSATQTLTGTLDQVKRLLERPNKTITTQSENQPALSCRPFTSALISTSCE